MSGLCGVVLKKGECAETLLFGTDYHSHLGSQLAGMATVDEHFKKKIHDISQAQFKSKFYDAVPEMTGSMGIGVISDSDAQPLLTRSRFGRYALAYAGLIENKDELVERLFANGSVFSESSTAGVNSIELLSKIIGTDSDLISGIESIFDAIQGSASILLLDREGIIAARDRLGRTPLIVGESQNGYMVASESTALMNLDFKPIKELGPGEIVRIDKEGVKVIRPARDEMQICSFLWIYTGYPASTYEGIGVEGVRERCGGFLAKRDDVEADLVGGVPDSGMGHGVGYAIESKIPFRRALVKYTPGYGRSYIPPSQSIRDHVAKMKLLPVTEVIQGNRVVVCEDSIVRGTQLRNFTIQKLWDSGAKEIHVRPACPPLMFPCKFALSTRRLDELVARKAIEALEGSNEAHLDEYLDCDSERYGNMIEWIARHLGATTLRFQRLDDMVEAIGLPREKLCLYCWNGQSKNYDYNPRQRELKLL
jgi:amidophosphoribosyltransferase